MPAEIVVPQLGESIIEATITRWLKREGDAIEAGEPLVELETDKVNVELPADQSGILEKITKRDGETVLVGDVIGVISAVGASPPPPKGGAEAVKELTPSSAGRGVEGNGGRAESPPQVAGGADLATPVARKLAADNRLDLRQVRGSGPHGRITKGDVANHIERAAAAPATAREMAREGRGEDSRQEAGGRTEPSRISELGTQNLELISRSERPEERVRMSRRRQTIAARLVEAQHTAAMLTTFNEIDMGAVMEIRKRRRDSFKEQYGVNLGFMSFFTKAVVAALKAFPYLNAELDGDEVVLKHYYDIGIAVSTDDGLVVPVLRDADKLTFAEIEKGIADLAARARDKQLTLPDLQGGTFTITNGGVFGSLMSTPILNAPQVGILGMHKIEERPIALNGQVVIRPMMYVAMSYDHRIIDGSTSVRFVVKIKELIEDPAALMLEG